MKGVGGQVIEKGLEENIKFLPWTDWGDYADALIGKHATVLKELAHGTPGRVKIGGESWLAVSTGAEHGIAVGRTVEVVSISGSAAASDALPTPASGRRAPIVSEAARRPSGRPDRET